MELINGHCCTKGHLLDLAEEDSCPSLVPAQLMMGSVMGSLHLSGSSFTAYRMNSTFSLALYFQHPEMSLVQV